MSDPMTTETAEMFLRRAKRAEGRIDGLMRKCVENAVRAYEAEAERDAYKAALEEIAKWGADREQHAARSDLSRDEERGWNLALSGLEYRARSVLAGVVSTREKDK